LTLYFFNLNFKEYKFLFSWWKWISQTLSDRAKS